VSGSGVATTVTVSSLAWPMLKRSGYPPNVAGGLLSAAGIGATLSPPTLGAAAFIIAEYLDVEYLTILVYATIPTLLYYLSCWLMTEADARRLGVAPVKTSDASLWALTLREGYHFLSLGAIAVFLILGFTSFLAVFWSIAIAFLLSMIRPESRLVTLPAFAVGIGAGSLPTSTARPASPRRKAWATSSTAAFSSPCSGASRPQRWPPGSRRCCWPGPGARPTPPRRA
jgi:TRAP-type uncharacterized transport system fused permease subunit